MKEILWPILIWDVIMIMVSVLYVQSIFVCPAQLVLIKIVCGVWDRAGSTLLCNASKGWDFISKSLIESFKYLGLTSSKLFQ